MTEQAIRTFSQFVQGFGFVTGAAIFAFVVAGWFQ